ncbi:glycoside hydrolase family 18 protein [Hypoxylon sp. EC38]|nr:glycoside hydrolase family 18 protein [Hypoxylon sp. EC38]
MIERPTTTVLRVAAAASRNQTLHPIYDKAVGVKYIAWITDQWVSYDDADTFSQKKGLVKGLGLGGFLIWAIDQDDDGLTALKVAISPNKLGGMGLARGQDDWQISNKHCYVTSCDDSCDAGDIKITGQKCRTGHKRSNLCYPLSGVRTKDCIWRGNPLPCNDHCHDDEQVGIHGIKTKSPPLIHTQQPEFTTPKGKEPAAQKSKIWKDSLGRARVNPSCDYRDNHYLPRDSLVLYPAYKSTWRQQESSPKRDSQSRHNFFPSQTIFNRNPNNEHLALHHPKALRLPKMYSDQTQDSDAPSHHTKARAICRRDVYNHLQAHIFMFYLLLITLRKIHKGQHTPNSSTVSVK